MSIKRWKLGWKRCDCVKCEAGITIDQTEEDCGWVMWEHHKEEVARLKAEVERLKEGNDCLDQMHDKEMERSAYLREEFNRSTAWGRGLESDLSHARVEVSFLKAEVERLSEIVQTAHADLFSENARLKAEVDRLRVAGEDLAHAVRTKHGVDFALEEWDKEAKEGKPSV